MAQPKLLKKEVEVISNSTLPVISDGIYKEFIETENKFNNLLNDYSETLEEAGDYLLNKINLLNQDISGEVYYAGSGDTTFTSIIKFNTIIRDSASCYSTSTGYVTIPVSGIYLFNFNFYSNNTSTNSRPAILFFDSNGTCIGENMINGYQGKNITTIRYCKEGDKVAIGPNSNNSTYSINLYAALNHNSFSWCLLSPQNI